MALPAVQANLTNIVMGWFNISQLLLEDEGHRADLDKLPMAEQDLTGIAERPVHGDADVRQQRALEQRPERSTIS